MDKLLEAVTQAIKENQEATIKLAEKIHEIEKNQAELVKMLAIKIHRLDRTIAMGTDYPLSQAVKDFENAKGGN
jgi:hypothetical protein